NAITISGGAAGSLDANAGTSTLQVTGNVLYVGSGSTVTLSGSLLVYNGPGTSNISGSLVRVEAGGAVVDPAVPLVLLYGGNHTIASSGAMFDLHGATTASVEMIPGTATSLGTDRPLQVDWQLLQTGFSTAPMSISTGAALNLDKA